MPEQGRKENIMQEKIEIRGRFTPWYEVTKEQAARPGGFENV